LFQIATCTTATKSVLDAPATFSFQEEDVQLSTSPSPTVTATLETAYVADAPMGLCNPMIFRLVWQSHQTTTVSFTPLLVADNVV
jgi:hypothetical protein